MESNPTWFKDAVIYELHVRSFFDSNNDGIGDFRGLMQKLDYLQDLGVTALWLLPFYPSPLKDDGYDIAGYTSINPDYGTMEDFCRFLDAAHHRGLRVITELVINHTSDQHPWFQRARHAPAGSPEREFYVWSDTPDKYSDTRIIFQDFESSNWAWDAVAQAYYWHRFYSHQPDLNFDNPAVHDAVFEVLDFWLDKGVDGLRLDAVPYLYEREGSNCENLPETHVFLKKLRQHVDEKYEDRMLLAEANQWPEDAVAYFGEGDECHMNFHFPLMPRLYLATERGDRFPIVDIMEQTPPIPDNCQWAIFLRNHDELTLEMVTDEERDYMYRSFAQHHKARINLGIRRRLAPLLGNDRKKFELLNALLFSLPGTPVLYYGDELGMGDNFFLGDRNGVRTPMQWSGDRNAGFSRANPQELFLPIIFDPEYHYEAVNVETQQQNPNSLLWFTKRMIAMRKKHPVLGRGTLRFLQPDNRRVLAFLREDETETLLVVANLSRYPQFLELDLSEFAGKEPRELFGYTAFPRITDDHYRLSIGPHSTFWFTIETGADQSRTIHGADGSLPTVELAGDEPWLALLSGAGRKQLQAIIGEALTGQRWFRAKSDIVQSVEVHDAIALEHEGYLPSQLVLFDVRLTYRGLETYVMPLALVTGDDVDRLPATRAVAYARVRQPSSGFEGLLCDAAYHPRFARRMLELARRSGETDPDFGLFLRGETMAPDETDARLDELVPRVMGAEQSNTSVAFGNRWAMKIYRKLDPGPNPEVEMGRFLTLRGFQHTPALGGVVQLMEDRDVVSSVAVLHEFIANEGDAWDMTLDELGMFFERVLSGEISNATTPTAAVGAYADDARLMGKRTAQLHATLAQGNDPAFKPESFSSHYQRSLYQALRNLAGTVFDSLRRTIPSITAEELAETCRAVLDSREAVTRRFSMITGRRIEAMRIRIHGDLHLGQFLSTGRDFLVTDFEGEPARPSSERRIKRSALRDVAGMIRSFHYAAHAALDRLFDQGLISEAAPRPELDAWARIWSDVVIETYVQGYLNEVAETRTGILPTEPADVDRLLDVFVMAKAVYELGYELDNRPDHISIPARDILRFLDEGPTPYAQRTL